MKNQILDVLYPESCIVCHRLLKKASGEMMCDACQKKVLPVSEPRCKRCSKPLYDLEQELCADCEGHTFCVESGRALYPYDKWMQKAVQNFKYNGELAGGIYFAGQMAEKFRDWIREISPDVIIPVPIHEKRMRFRGFNQASCLAEHLGGRLGIPVEERYLIRIENTEPQKELGRHARKHNLQKSFMVSPDWHKEDQRTYRSVLLVDDIYTTGVTLEACGRALKKAGTVRVHFLCLCIGRGDS